MGIYKNKKENNCQNILENSCGISEKAFRKGIYKYCNTNNCQNILEISSARSGSVL
jgi:hypothetical protein